MVDRALSLLTSLTAARAASTAALAAYWNGPRVPGHAPLHWSDTVVPMIYGWLIIVAALPLPVILGHLRRVLHPQRPAWRLGDRV